MTTPELLEILKKVEKETRFELDLSGQGLTKIPPEIGRLTWLTQLVLNDNQLTQLPPEIGLLKNLIILNVNQNHLSSLPPEIGQLTSLVRLDLDKNQLTSLPVEIGRLIDLTGLSMDENQLTVLPEEIGQLTALQSLYVAHNRLIALPRQIGQLAKLSILSVSDNQLRSLPAQIGRMTELKKLYMYDNRINALPREIGRLTQLTGLYCGNNQLTELPVEIGELRLLTALSAYNNQLSTLPKEIGQLTNLQELNLSSNPIREFAPEIFLLTKMTRLSLYSTEVTVLPKEIGNLTELTDLILFSNSITELPKEIGELTNLANLDLKYCSITALPLELGRLEKLTSLDIKGCPCVEPPPGIVAQGTKAVVSYLSEKLSKTTRRQWVSKLLIVGEGGVGKTSLLRALRGDGFEDEESTTHGIAIKPLTLAHPSINGVVMKLKAWDFGGQVIYHATHQFFLTDRSLFVLVWNARLGYEQGKLYYWLDTIQARAPKSPILIVATHVDERNADLPQAELRRSYPQIVEFFAVSNKAVTGIEPLKATITRLSAELPLMGESWPANWLDAANALRNRPEASITPAQLREVMTAHKVDGERVAILAQWLHTLGDILYFQDDDVLNDLVILRPQWVTEVISRVLESEIVKNDLGIINRADMDLLWSDIEPGMREHLLRLMERFDLSYRTLVDREISLVVELLSWDEPDYKELWDAIGNRANTKEITMRFWLNTILPAGVPTWFIARSHRFTTRTHWRLGALFADGPEQTHLGLIRAFPHKRSVELVVRGPAPQNFFALLRDGLEVTLARFQGLKIERKIPCPGHDNAACSYEFDQQRLQKAIERTPAVLEVECQESFEKVSVPGLLFGIHWRIRDEVLDRIESLEDTNAARQEVLLDRIADLRSLGTQSLVEMKEFSAQVQREFSRVFFREQSFAESHCPAVFTLRPLGSDGWKKRLVGQKIELQLYCNAPGHWHPTTDGGRYAINEPASWLAKILPYVQKLVKVIKHTAPFIGPVVGVASGEAAKAIEYELKLMGELVKELPEVEDQDELELSRSAGRVLGLPGLGPELRSLRLLLDHLDPSQQWGGLHKVLTPEHDYLWLCPEHAEVYAR